MERGNDGETEDRERERFSFPLIPTNDNAERKTPSKIFHRVIQRHERRSSAALARPRRQGPGGGRQENEEKE